MNLTDRKRAKELNFEENGFLVRYGAMEIVEKGKLVSYVSAKCYVLGEEKIKIFNGKDGMEYEVVFAWNIDGKEGVVPIYEDGKCINSQKVRKVFTSFIECENYVDFANFAIIGGEILERKIEKQDEKEKIKKDMTIVMDGYQQIAYQHIELEEKEVPEKE